MTKRIVEHIGTTLLEAIVVVGVLAALLAFWQAADGLSPFTAFGANNATTTVVIGNSAPSVSSVTLNGGSAITLTANTTTNVSVGVTISDNNGCSDITGGSTTVMIYRTSVGSSSCMTTASNLNCYRASAFTASSSCSGNTVTATTTFAVYYFAQATDASSSYSSSDWTATVVFKDSSVTTGTSDSTGRELNTLTALDVTTSSINYGTLSASSTTAGVNQITTSTNAGNSTTTLQLSALATLTSGANSIATTSQRYATSSFTFYGLSVALQQTAANVDGYKLTAPTSTTNVQSPIFWGLEVPAGTATGTYNGTTLFTAIWAA
ncbi:MAG: hypothetical protein RL681_600 [Candidatus Parcubacteria bacterium]|jgi:hypothetical protein